MSDTIEIHTGPLGAVFLLLLIGLVFLLGALFDRWHTRRREMRAVKARFLAAPGTPLRPHRLARIIRGAAQEIDQVIPNATWTRLAASDVEVHQASGANVLIRLREADRG